MEHGSRAGTGFCDLFNTDTILRIGRQAAEQNIRESVDGCDGIVQVMDERWRHRDDGVHRRLPGSPQGALNCHAKGVGRDVGDEAHLVGSGAEGVEPEPFIRREAIDKEAAVRRGQTQGTDSIACTAVRESWPHEYPSHRMGTEVCDAVMQGVGERKVD